MEHIFQMDCTGCCCESSGCDTCLSNTTTTMTTTTTVDCPDDLDYYYDCEYLLDCYDGSENPTTDHVLKTYDCKWIKEWMSEPTICFDFFGADCDPINNNTECSGSQTCEPSDFGGNTCQSCYANIPGAEVETTTEKPCYYFDHYGVGDRNYSAYDCVEDYENGDGCIYIDAILDNSPTSGETGCEILLDNVNCPNPPEDCTCVAEWIFTSSCDVPCGGGGRDSLYTCVDPNCEFECVSDAFYPVGEVSEPQCNTHLCSSVVCETDLIGDGYCDFSYQLNYVIQYNDGSADSVNNNLDFCDWDGGDCCAQSCEPDDTTLVTFGRRGDNCAFAGGGCIDVPTDIKDDVETLIFQTWFNPGAQSGGTDPTCTQVGADSWDCCMPIVMFDNADEPSFQCEYGGVTHDKCALPSGRCLDPQYGTSSSSTTSTTSTSTTTS